MSTMQNEVTDEQELEEPEDSQEMNEALEKEARDMGWQPQEEFKGNPDKWNSAADFVERGKQLLPILSANNKRLKNELLTKTRDLDRITQAHEKSLKTLESHFAKVAEQAVKDAKASLKNQLREARENGDVDLEVETLDKLQELKESDATSDRHVEPQPSVEPLSPEYKAWEKENPWYGTDRARTDAILGIAKRLRDSGDMTPGRAFFDKCTDLLNEEFQEEHQVPSRVEPARRNGSSTSRGKSFSDLPKAAQVACWDDVDELVGPGKSYKTKADWEKAYAAIYFGSDNS